MIFSLVAVAGAGCSELRTNQPAGAACVRSVECMAGLACVESMCSSDLSSLAEAGTLPPLDLGGGDGGVTPVTDMGPPIDDMSMPPMDMGTPEVDMGTPEVDMGTPEVDMGTPEVDLGTPEVDMGTPEVDMGDADAGA